LAQELQRDTCLHGLDIVSFGFVKQITQ